MQPDYPHKIFYDRRTSYPLLVQALVQEDAAGWGSLFFSCVK
jgi:hypothetical protein